MCILSTIINSGMMDTVHNHQAHHNDHDNEIPRDNTILNDNTNAPPECAHAAELRKALKVINSFQRHHSITISNNSTTTRPPPLQLAICAPKYNQEAPKSEIEEDIPGKPTGGSNIEIPNDADATDGIKNQKDSCGGEESMDIPIVEDETVDKSASGDPYTFDDDPEAIEEGYREYEYSEEVEEEDRENDEEFVNRMRMSKDGVIYSKEQVQELFSGARDSVIDFDTGATLFDYLGDTCEMIEDLDHFSLHVQEYKNSVSRVKSGLSNACESHLPRQRALLRISHTVLPTIDDALDELTQKVIFRVKRFFLLSS